MRVYGVSAFQDIELVFFDQFEFGKDPLPDFKVQFIHYFCF